MSNEQVEMTLMTEEQRRRAEWLESHAQAVDLIESLINRLGNVGPWQGAVLRELTLRLEEKGTLFGPYAFSGLGARPYYEAPRKQIELTFHRRDFAPMGEW